MKRTLALIASAMLLMSLLSACGAENTAETPMETEPATVEVQPEQTTEKTETEKDTFTIGVDAEFTTLNPITTGTEGSFVFRNGVYETLFVYNENGEVEPWLAEGYEWRDDNTLVITLKQGVTFHNGNAFTAEDVLYTISAVAAAPSAASRVSDIILEDSYAEDDYTVVLKTQGYSAVLVSNLAGELLCMQDKEFCEENGGLVDQVANGTGAYVLDSWNMGTDCVLTKNENYWNSSVLDPYFKTIDIVFFNDNNTAFMEYESGTLDAVYVENAESIDRLTAGDVENTYYETVGTNFVTSLFMSQNVGEQFKDINLRKAIAHAIDVQTLVTAICGNSVKLASSMFPESMPAHVDLGLYEYNPDLAREYLNTYMSENGVDSVDLMACLPSVGYNADLAESIQAYLSDIGINMQITTGAISDIIPMMMSGTVNFGISSCGGGNYPADMFVAMKRTTANLLTKFSDESVLNLIDDATFESDWDTCVEMYQQIQQIVYDNYYFIPLYENLHYYAVNNGITNFTFGMGHGVNPSYLGWNG